MSETDYCIRCKHYSIANGPWGNCKRTEVSETSLVTGERVVTKVADSCNHQRNCEDADCCGRKARFFVPREEKTADHE